MSDVSEQLENIFKETDTAAILVDGFAALCAAKNIGLAIDWKKFSEQFKYLCRVRRLHFYATFRKQEEEEVDWKPLYSWLAYNGYVVTSKPGFTYNYDVHDEMYDRTVTRVGLKTGVEVNFAVDALTLAQKVDHIILFTDNDDYAPLVEAIKNLGVTVTLIANSIVRLKELARSDTKTSVPVPKLLTRIADNFIELDDLGKIISNDKAGQEGSKTV